MENREFAVRIRYAMSVKGLRNKDVVARYKEVFGTTIRPATVSQLLSGRFKPTDERAGDLAKVLGVDKLWLQGYGNMGDYDGGYKGEELHEALGFINMVYPQLRPDLQQLVLDFVQILFDVSESYDMSFQMEKRQKTLQGKRGRKKSPLKFDHYLKKFERPLKPMRPQKTK